MTFREQDRWSPPPGHIFIIGEGFVPHNKQRLQKPFTLEGYSFHSLLGSGGFAQVFYGKNKIQEDFVLKVLHPEHADRLHTQAHHEEAELLKTLSHPGIPKVVGVYEKKLPGEPKDLPMFIQKCVRGFPASTMLRWPGGFSLEATHHVAMGLADIVDYLAIHGIVHRDIKPANILIDQDGKVFLTDFGIAHTPKGSVLREHKDRVYGTMGYIAPEYAIHKTITPACDVFSTGATLYELLTGRLPLHTNNSRQMLEDTAAGKFLPLMMSTTARKKLGHDSRRIAATQRVFDAAFATSSHKRFQTTGKLAQAYIEATSA